MSCTLCLCLCLSSLSLSHSVKNVLLIYSVSGPCIILLLHVRILFAIVHHNSTATPPSLICMRSNIKTIGNGTKGGQKTTKKLNQRILKLWKEVYFILWSNTNKHISKYCNLTTLFHPCVCNANT